MDPLGIIRPRHLNRRPCHWLTEDWQWNCLLASSSFFRIHLLGITYVLLLTTILLLFGSSWAHLEDQVARALLLLWSIYMSGRVSGGVWMEPSSSHGWKLWLYRESWSTEYKNQMLYGGEGNLFLDFMGTLPSSPMRKQLPSLYLLHTMLEGRKLKTIFIQYEFRFGLIWMQGNNKGVVNFNRGFNPPTLILWLKKKVW